MKTILFYSLSFLFLVSCSGNATPCAPSVTFKRAIKEWIGSRGLQEGQAIFEPAAEFPEKFERDAGKCGSECVLELPEGSIVFREYTFSSGFIQDHALASTFAEFLVDEDIKESYAYARGVSVSPQRGVVVLIESREAADQLSDDADAFIRNYRE